MIDINDPTFDILADGYLRITPLLWDWIPCWTNICYVLIGSGTESERFHKGNIRGREEIDDGVAFIIGNDDDTTVIKYSMIEKLWKKYDKYAFVEIHLMRNSLAIKNQQIIELNERVTRLETLMRGLLTNKLGK